MESLKKSLRNKLYLFIFIGLTFTFFYPFVFFGKIPIPADTIVGMFHPWRDIVWNNFKSGVPFKNYLITDPVRQQYVWRKLAVDEFKKGQLPLWNPYSFSGTPLLANFQTAAFYPLNLLFFILPFDLSWGVLIMLQTIFGGIFIYLYLRQIKVSKYGSLLGASVFSFSGFSIVWLEWNTIGQVIMWLPLMLLCIEKLFRSKSILWSAVFIFSLISSFFAGHLQIFFYCLLLATVYMSAKVIALKHHKLKMILLFVICYLLFFIASSIQWLPTLKFILLSARNIDQGSFLKPGWFIPWQNLIQFVIPDFFGNPATGNYWGIWNYAEFVGYIGIAPLIFVLYALFFRFDKKVLFFGFFTFFGLVFALPTPVAKIPYLFNIPLISSSQPTRFIFIIDFAGSILAALGFDHFLTASKYRYKKISTVLILLFIIFAGLWVTVFLKNKIFNGEIINSLAISQRNMIFPSLIFILSSVLIFICLKIRREQMKFITYFLLFAVIAVDLLRFGWKFTPFTNRDWIFPSTKLISILKEDNTYSRLMSADSRVMPPNFSAFYHIPDVSGYDPLYLLAYNQLVASWERDKSDITPAAFNRIITPVNFESFMADLLGVKYVLSLKPLESPKLNLVAVEGTTYLYQNSQAFPKVFFVNKLVKAKDRQEEIDRMFTLKDELRYIAVFSENMDASVSNNPSDADALVAVYENNYVRIKTNSKDEKLLILNDIYYPSWKAYIDGRLVKIWRVDFSLRGVIVPAGEHTVEFKVDLI